MTFVTHLECSATGDRFDADAVHNLSPTGKPLLVRYDLDRMKRELDRDALAQQPPGLWRYAEMLPVADPRHRVTLGEVETPLLPLHRTGARLKADRLWTKDEGRLPTGSFKARGMALAVSMAKRFGLTRLAIPTNGNAGAAMAAYGRAAGMEVYVFCPEETPDVNVREIALQGARVWRVNGQIDQCGAIVREGKERMGWFDVSTLKEPYRIEGKKTMGLELAEQLGWTLPDAILYPTGGGTGLIGMWKAFDELEALGWIGPKRPKMIAVQATGCAPIVRAFDEGVEHATRWENAATVASGIRVPQAVGDFLILRAVRNSGGFAIAVDDGAIMAAQADAARDDGVLLGPEGAATLAAWRVAVDDGRLDRRAHTILFNCGTPLKYPMPPVNRALKLDAIDWEDVESA
ncbi:MAG: threonine synthase [Minwuia sp.]|nr:threonine synthase [Minwuia sp.]